MHEAAEDANYDEDGNIQEEGFVFRDEIREQDRFLPVANIARIMKKVLPVNAKIAKDAKEGIQECLSEFISFITSEASDKCQQEKRKTINGDDLLWAMSALGFDKYIEPLKIYLAKYRESVKGEKPEKKPPIRPKEAPFPSIHAQPKTAISGGMNMMMTMGPAPVGGAPVAPPMHQGGGDSISEYPSYHHPYVTANPGMQPGLTVDPSMHMAQSQQQQQQRLVARPKTEEGIPEVNSGATSVTGYTDISIRPVPQSVSAPLGMQQYPLPLPPYEHDPSGALRSGMTSFGGPSDSFPM